MRWCSILQEINWFLRIMMVDTCWYQNYPTVEFVLSFFRWHGGFQMLRCPGRSAPCTDFWGGGANEKGVVEQWYHKKMGHVHHKSIHLNHKSNMFQVSKFQSQYINQSVSKSFGHFFAFFLVIFYPTKSIQSSRGSGDDEQHRFGVAGHGGVVERNKSDASDWLVCEP